MSRDEGTGVNKVSDGDYINISMSRLFESPNWSRCHLMSFTPRLLVLAACRMPPSLLQTLLP
jgi:hypothetical protein